MGKCVEECCDPDGRYVALSVEKDDVRFYLMAIYAPNKDSPVFFEEVFNKAMSANDKVVVIGDYNTVIDPELDRKNCGTVPAMSKAAEKINQIAQENKLEDIWRLRNNQTRRYSWYRGRNRKTLQASRLDLAIISSGICDMVHNTFYMAGIRTDHSAFFVGLQLTNHERGRGYWKFNTSYLSDIEFVKSLQTQIRRICQDTVGMNSMERWEIIKSEN